MRLRVLVVDDEPLARRRLGRLLDQCDAEVVGEAGDGAAAAALLAALPATRAPHILLLDVRMPGTDGLTLARAIAAAAAQAPVATAAAPLPLVVFTTAHAAHAVDAFDTAALDYLLKPVELPRLARALERARARLAATESHDPAASLTAPAPLRLAARSGDRLALFDPRHLTRLWAQDKYTAFLHAGVEHLLDESLTTLEQRLAPLGFVRVHRGELVQLSRIRALHCSGDASDRAEVELDDGQRAAVSRRFLPELRRRLTGE